jgi:diguanylate cyclase (GGDEF)-like protein
MKSIFTENVFEPDTALSRQVLLKLFQQYRGSYAGSMLSEEFEQLKVHSGFSQEELVSGLIQALFEGDASACLELVSRMCQNNVPFMIVAHEITFLRDTLVKQAIKKGYSDAITSTFTLFADLERALADVYLKDFLSILSKRNNVRLRHISALTEKNLLVHFEKHLIWMDRLAKAVAARDIVAMPDVEPDKCDFGKWLYSDGAALIRDKSHYQHLLESHASMHDVTKEICHVLGKDRDSLHLYALLKKAENYSLDLGNEIALLNSMVIMSIYNKDPLTGALTRRSLYRVLLSQLEISALTGISFCLVMCDIDYFKSINDNYGHVAGDQCIKKFAEFLSHHLRQADMLFRIGGDEFLIILPSTTYAQGSQVTNKLCSRIQIQLLDAIAEPTAMTASYGLLEVSGANSPIIDVDLAQELIKTCDKKLYLAKQRGRNQVA